MPTTDRPPPPDRSPIERYLAELHRRYAGLTDGQVADYIPELAKADPSGFGICIATRDGHVYEVGDSRCPFTIQSISKALVYGLALEERGEACVLSKIGVEPSGDAFNAISLKPGSGAPFNPMINAGAIAACSLIPPSDGLSRFEQILRCLSAYAGRTLDVDAAVYASESMTGHRNRAIGWMLRNFDIIEEEPTDILETYFRQCAIRVSCRDLAVMGATLANQGINPLTRERAVSADHVDNILSVMATCGMYDYSGEWLYRIGMPAKSGVGGGILAVLPGQLGIGIYSPLLDAQGNSARGIKVCQDLARDLSLHLFAAGAAPQSAFRLGYDGSQISSHRRRAPALQQTLRSSGHRIRLVELQGELIFSTFEPIVRLALKNAPYCQYFILNLKNVVHIDTVALRMIRELQENLERQGVELLSCHIERFGKALKTAGIKPEAQFVDDDAALEYAENKLLDGIVGASWRVWQSVPLRECQLLSALKEEELSWLDAQMPEGKASAGDYLIRAGDAGNSLYLLLSGAIEVRIPARDGGPGKRVNVFEAGMAFGEMGLLDGSPRSADVVALSDLHYRVIRRDLFERLDEEYPRLKIALLEQISMLLSSNLRKLTTEVSAFRG